MARQLLHDVATAWADSIIAGAAILNEASLVAVAILGALTEMGALLQDPLLEALGRSDARLRVRSAQGTSSDGARCPATRDDGIHEPWMMRVDPGVIRFGNSFATSKGDHA